jgi:hypothetical protein
MWEQTLEVARLATAWSRPMSEIMGMTRFELAAMDQAYTELARAQKRAQKR